MHIRISRNHLLITAFLLLSIGVVAYYLIDIRSSTPTESIDKSKIRPGKTGPTLAQLEARKIVHDYKTKPPIGSVSTTVITASPDKYAGTDVKVIGVIKKHDTSYVITLPVDNVPNSNIALDGSKANINFDSYANDTSKNNVVVVTGKLSKQASSLVITVTSIDK